MTFHTYTINTTLTQGHSGYFSPANVAGESESIRPGRGFVTAHAWLSCDYPDSASITADAIK